MHTRRPTTRPSVRHLAPLAALAAASVALAACGTSAGDSAGKIRATAPATTAAARTSGAPTSAAPTAAAPTTAAAAPASTAPQGSDALPGVPAVSGATDLTKGTTIAKGTGTASTQLVVRDLVVGTGTQAAATSTVQVQYTGAVFGSGKVFDSSWQRGQPATFPLNGVVPGFAQGIAGMKVGARREIVIPPALGYGSRGNPQAGITGDDTIVFVVDLLSVS